MAGSVSPARWAVSNAFRAGVLVWLALASVLVVALVWTDREGLAQAAGQFIAADWRFGSLALLLLTTVDFVKAFRWQVLYGLVRPPFRRVLQAQVVGQAANSLIPLRLGEVLRVSWAAPTPSGIARGTAGLVLTKAVDAVVLAALIGVIFGNSLVAEVQLLPAVALGLVVVVSLGLAQRYRHIGGGGLGAVRPLLAGATRYARELHLGTVAVVLATSAFAWVVGGLANMAVLSAVGITPNVEYAGRVLVSGYIAGLLPAPPGRLGVFEAAVAAALVAGGISLPLAVAAALVLHLLQLLEVGLLVVAATRWR